jgi:hypothetical protein
VPALLINEKSLEPPNGIARTGGRRNNQAYISF